MKTVTLPNQHLLISRSTTTPPSDSRESNRLTNAPASAVLAAAVSGPSDWRSVVSVYKRYFPVEAKRTGMSTQATEDRILEVLEEDAQASYAEIAEQASVSKPTVRKYINQLEDDGVIVGYSADVDPKKLSSQTIALVGLDVASERYVEATQAIKNLEEVEALYSSSGDHMLMAEVRAEDGDSLGEIISEELLEIDGVTAAHPSFLQERLK